MSEHVTIDDIVPRVGQLAGEDRTITELPGGLTNTNYKVVVGGRSYVVRLSSKDAGLLAIDRENEHCNSVIAAEAGVGAGVVAYLPELGALVLEFIEGTTMSAEQLRAGDRLREVAQVCRELHACPPFRDDFDMFRVQERYAEIVQQRGLRLPDRYLEFAPQVRMLERAMAVRDDGRVPCNNDLLAENLIWTGERFRLIDYEYSGNNDPMFELGNLWSESNLTLAQLEELVGHYYGAVRASKVARARLHGILSKYGWMLWASIQDGVSTLDFDFWGWGMEKYERAVAELDGPDFAGLCEDVQRDD